MYYSSFCMKTIVYAAVLLHTVFYYILMKGSSLVTQKQEASAVR